MTTVSADHTIINGAKFNLTETTYSIVAWRIIDDTPAVMVSIETVSDSLVPGYAIVCEIEVREEFRGRGLALETIRLLESEYGPIYSDGGYTPSGFAALSGHLPVAPGCVLYGEPVYSQVHFVEDWDSMQFRGQSVPA